MDYKRMMKAKPKRGKAKTGGFAPTVGRTYLKPEKLEEEFSRGIRITVNIKTGKRSA